MRFWDASAIVPLIVAEPPSTELLALHTRDPVQLVWWVTEIECVSAVARREREGLLSADASADALKRLDELKRRWNEIQPLDIIRRTARRLLRVHALRTADSLQLAAAVVASEGDPGSLEIVCADRRLADAASREGFTPLAL